MKPRKRTIPFIVAAVLCVVLAVGVSTAFSACGMKDDGTWMHCHDAQMGAAVCGAIAAVLYAIAGFAGNRMTKFTLGALCTIVCIAVLFIPDVIVPMCSMDTMRCHALMAPFARVCAGIAGIAGIVGIVTGSRLKANALPRYGRL